MKYLRLITALAVPVLSAGSLIAVGYASWAFTNEISTGVEGEVVVATESTLAGNLELSKDSNYSDFRVVFSQGGSEYRYDLNQGIEFMPAVQFTFSVTLGNFQASDFEGAKFYLNAEFTGSDAFNTYAILAGETKVSLFGINDSTLNNVTQTTANGFTTYTYVGSFTPEFAYQSGMKPTTEDAYNDMIYAFETDTGTNTLTLKVTLENEVATA